jgi:hypothetical protein
MASSLSRTSESLGIIFKQSRLPFYGRVGFGERIKGSSGAGTVLSQKRTGMRREAAEAIEESPDPHVS